MPAADKQKGLMFMDYQYYRNTPQENRKRSGRMETAALVLGVIAIATLLLVYPALVCGSLSIVFALLSRGGEISLTSKARAGLILGSIALGIVAFLFLYTLVIANVYYGGLEEMAREVYAGMGIDFDALMQSVYK